MAKTIILINHQIDINISLWVEHPRQQITLSHAIYQEHSKKLLRNCLKRHINRKYTPTFHTKGIIKEAIAHPTLISEKTKININTDTVR